MKRKNHLAVFMALTTAFSTAMFSCRSVKNIDSPKDKSIVVLYDNDVHCGVDGYAKMAGLRNAISDTAYVAVVSSGDYLQGGTVGTISEGRYVVDIMKGVGYDAVTLGNHEFDYKTPRMFTLLSLLGAPVTCVNLRNTNTGEFPFAPYVMKTMGKKKVAFVGVTTPTTVATEEYAFFDEKGTQLFDLCMKDVYRMAQSAVDKARAAGADYVIALTHLGEDLNDMNVDSHGLIRSTTGIDVVLDAHTHSVIPSDTVHNKQGQPVMISQTGTKFANIGKLLITADGRKTLQLLPTSEITNVDAAVKHVTDSINTLVDLQTNMKVCDSEVALTILDDKGKQEVRKGETNSGDLVADAFLALTDADFALTNGGGIRCGLSAGTLTYGDVISMLPYDNRISVVEITGKQLVKVLSACTSSLPQENGDFPQVSGLKFTVDMKNGKKVTDVVVRNKQTGAYEPVELERTYQLATIDYCIVGGGFHGLLKKNNIIKKTGVDYGDCLVRYLVQNLSGKIGKEYAAPQGRITVKY